VTPSAAVENAHADNALHAYLIKIAHKTSELVQSYAVKNRYREEAVSKIETAGVIPKVKVRLEPVGGTFLTHGWYREATAEIYIALFVVIAENCSFPYTYEGGLYYRCIENMPGVSTAEHPFACVGVNATPAVCQFPGAP